MVPPSHSRISRYHGWITRRPVLVLVGAALIGARRGRARHAAEAQDVVRRAASQQRSGRGRADPHAGAARRPVAAADRHPVARPRRQPALRGGADAEAARAAAHRRQPGDVPRPRRARVLRAEQVALRLRGGSGVDPRQAAHGDQQAQEPAATSRWTTTPSRSSRCGSGCRARAASTRSFPAACSTSKGAGGDYVWIAALPPGGLFVENAGEALLNAANDLIKADPPTRYHPEMKVEPAGPIVTGIASRHAVERDIISVTITCLIIVALSIGLYFRRWRAIPLTGIPAAMGTVMAFAVAQLAFGYLNSSTAFLGSIIIGNGINYAIILMSRYEEHRARGNDPEEALRCALGGTWRGTLVASIAASAAYASLTVTSFRGFYQFGVMGATGALFCWLATYSILPAMLTLLDRRERATRPSPAPRAAGVRPAGPLPPASRRRGHRGVRGARGRERRGPAPLPQGPVRIRFPQAQREAGHDRGGEAVQQEPQRPVRPLAVADHPAHGRGRRGRAAQGRDPAPGSRGARHRHGRPDRDDLRPAARAAGGAAAQARGAGADSQADPRPGAGRPQREGEGGSRQDRSVARSARAGPDGPAADRPAPVHGGRRLGGQGGAGLSARARDLGLERARSAAHRLGAADDQARQRQGDRDLGLRGGVRLDDPIGPARRSDRHRRVADRRADHHRVHDPARGGGADGAGDARPRACC